MALPASPPDRPRRGFLLGLLVGLIVAISARSLVAGIILNSRSGASTVASSPPSSTLPSTPSSRPEPVKPAAVVTAPFNLRDGWAKGEKLAFGVSWMSYPDARCSVHTFTWRGKTHGGFQSDCSDWSASGKDLLFFYVDFWNPTKKPVTVRLRDLVLTDPTGPDLRPGERSQRGRLPPLLHGRNAEVAATGKMGWVRNVRWTNTRPGARLPVISCRGSNSRRNLQR